MSKKKDNFYLLNDKVVKKLFTNGSKVGEEFMITLLSYILNISKEEIKNNFIMLHPEIGVNKNKINSEADIVYENKKTYFSIEFNYSYYKFLVNKNFSYVCILYVRQLNNQKDYEKIKGIYSINIDAFDYYKEKRFMYESIMMEKNLYKEQGIPIHYIDINLEYLRNMGYNDIIKEKDPLKKLLYLFVCKDQKKLDQLYEGNEMMKEFREEANKIVNDLDLLFYYDKEQLDQKIVFNNGYNRGKDEGREEGLIEGLVKGKIEGKKEGKREGIIENKLEIAKKMIKANKPLEEIMTFTDLSKNKILQLKRAI